MATQLRIETKTLYTEAIRQNIAKKDWTRLSDVMMGPRKLE